MSALATRLAHVLTAALLAYADPLALVSATLAYAAYQAFSDRKPKDMVDWIVGIVVGVLIREAVRLTVLWS